MSTHVSPDHRAPRPPLALDLVDADRRVGWVSGHTVGFRGFADEVEAAHAAWVAYRSLSRRLARRFGTRPIPIDIGSVALQRRGKDEVILASGRMIGTLVRPGPESPAGPDSFGFEIAIPHVTDELGMRSKAHFIYRTLRKAGTRWALWQPASAERLSRPERPTVSDEGEATTGLGAGAPASGAEGIDTANHQHGGYRHVTQRPRQRPWWLRAVPWRGAGRLGRGASGRAVGV